jgi:hypothetical protein
MPDPIAQPTRRAFASLTREARVLEGLDAGGGAVLDEGIELARLFRQPCRGRYQNRERLR